MKYADKERNRLMKMLKNSDTPREDLHEAYKERMSKIFFELILEFIQYTRSSETPKKITNIDLEKWIKSFIDNRFIPE